MPVGSHAIGDPPAVREPELSQHGAGRGVTERLHDVLAKLSHCHGTHEQNALAGEPHQSLLWVDLE
jgi:hypothetical protein